MASTGTPTQGTTAARAAAVTAAVQNVSAVGGQTVAAPFPSRVPTLGQAVDRTNAVGPDLVGKFMGYGTAANQGQNMFNTKETVLLGPDWANVLNEYLGTNGQSQLEQALTNGIRNYSVGLAGVVEGQRTVYMPSISQYYPDDRARISIAGKDGNGNRLAGVPLVLLPGSTEALAANGVNGNGYAVGLAYVKNPMNETGYLRPGSKGWRDTFARWADGNFAGDEFDLQHLFGQGGVYGLGPVYKAYGIDVTPNYDRNDPSGTVRYSIKQDLRSIVGDSGFMRAVQNHYDTYLKNPDQVRLGRYGAANLMLRHADKMNTTATHGAADPAGVNDAIVRTFQDTGSVAGVAKWGRNSQGQDFADFSRRRGITANPLRDANGQPVRQSNFSGAGQCNIYGSGPGVSQQATQGGSYGFRFTKANRKYLSKRRGQQGAKMADSTYYCAGTPDYTVNPDRDIYASAANGGTRGAADASLNQVIEAYGNSDFNSEDLSGRYASWVTNPAAYGTNPNFMLPVQSGRAGFSRAAPAIRRQNMTPQQQQDYNNLNLTRAFKATQSANALNDYNTQTGRRS